MKKILVLVGNDKIGRSAIHALEKTQMDSDLNILIDSSSNFKRVIELLKKKKISPYLLFLMFTSELFRKRILIKNYKKIYSVDELKKIIKKDFPKIVLMYRCGLIINKDILNLGISFYNIHASKLPDYGGIGTIYKALKDKSYNQCATLHEVITKIDGGKVIDTYPYKLNKNQNYFKNEEIAYEAGTNLFIKSLKYIIKNINKS